MFPGRPFGNEIGIGDQYARRALMRAEHADGLAGLHQQRLVRVERLQALDDAVEGVPVARGAADAAIDDEILRPLRDLGIEIVHQHAHGRFRAPVAAGDLRAAGRADNPGVLGIAHWSCPWR